MIEDNQAGLNLPRPIQIPFPSSLRTQYTSMPILNKVQAFQNTLFSGYSNGLILQFRYNQAEKQYNYVNKFHPYQNIDVIDIDRFDNDVLLTCTHNQVSLFNLTKNKSISLKGHESTPIAVSAHPVCPYVVSVSNSIIQHDIRMKKPINVNFITAPAFDIQYFVDGKDFLLSGEPCRIGRSKWVRTLMNGMAKPSINSKFVAINQMNGLISLWDWQQSQRMALIDNVKNTQTYQPIHFGLKSGQIRDIYYFQDNGSILKYQIVKRVKTEHKLFDVTAKQNWKMTTRTIESTTKSVILYEHTKALMKAYDL